MHGNVWEFCSDRYIDYDGVEKFDPENAVIDPTGPDDEKYTGRAARGAGFSNLAERCRSASRLYIEAESHSRHVGFRLVLLK